MRKKISAPTIQEEFTLRIQTEQRRDKITRWAPVIILGFLVLFFSVLSFSSFFTVQNLTTLVTQWAMTFIVALGLTFVTLIGAVDLSVDGMVGLSAASVSLLILNAKNGNNFGIFGIIITMLIGAGVGYISGSINTRFKVPSFMVTYAMMSITQGFGIMFGGGGGLFAQIEDKNLLAIPQTTFLGLPVITWIAIVFLMIGWIIQEKTAFGRHAIAVGTNEEIPRMTGVNIGRVKRLIYMIAGTCFAVAGILGALRLSRGEVDIGKGQYFPAMAAVIIGGTSLAGGRGGVLNTVVGVMIITVLNNGLLLLGVNSYIREGLQGFIILIAMAVSIVRNTRTIAK